MPCQCLFKDKNTNKDNKLTAGTKEESGKIWLSNPDSNHSSWDNDCCDFKLSSGTMVQSPDDVKCENTQCGDTHDHREILLLSGSYTLPQYCYATADNDNDETKNCGRLNPLTYDVTKNGYEGGSTLQNKQSLCTDAAAGQTDNFTLQVLIRQLGITYAGSGDSVEAEPGELRFRIKRDSYKVSLTKGTGISKVSGGGKYLYGETATINATPDTGYHWVNWTGSSTLTATTNSLTVKSDASFTANGAINSSTLIIDPNGGTWSNATGDVSPITKTYGSTLSVPNPTIDNYTVKFDGNGGTAEYTEATTDKTFKCWAGVGTEGVAVGTAGTFDPATKIFTYGATYNGIGILTATWTGSYDVTLPGAKRTGHTIEGWYKDDGTYVGKPGEPYTASSNITLTAKWRIHQSTLTIDPNGGKWNNNTAKKDLKENYGTQKDIPDPTVDNYTVTFDGNGGTPEKTSETTQKKFIKWKNVENIPIDIGDAGVFVPNNKQFIYGYKDNGTGTMTATWEGEYKVTMPGASREGYELLGWNADKNADKNATTATYEKGKKVEVTGNSTYYAVWKEMEYDIVYDMNGGTGTPVTDTKTYFMDYTVKSDTECGYTREGYTFIGWAVNPDATDPLAENFQLPEKYQPGQVLDETLINDENEHIKNGKLTLYAVWMPLIKIIYMMNNTATTAEANSEYTMSGENIIDDGENGDGIPMNEGCTIYDNTVEDAVQAYALDASEEVEENFKMEGVYTYQDNNGISYTENVTSTVVGWAFDNEEVADSCDYTLAEEVGKAKDIYDIGIVREEDSITTGTPRAEFYQNADGQVDPAVLQPENDNTIYANLFAVYDYGPKVHAVPLYYTLYNAQIGYITLDDLLSHVEVLDTEDTNIVAVDTIPAKEDRAEDTTYYTVIDYQPSDFTQLAGNAMVSETYYAVDSAGNVTKKRINVTIVDVDASIQDADPKDGESRFISYKYLWTLKETSIWLTEPYFSQLVSAMYYEEVEPEIKAAYPHIYNERTESLALQMIDVDMTPPIPIFGDMFKHEIRGTRQYNRPPKQVWIFEPEDVLAVKQFVEENGFTTYADKEELNAFLEKFDYCYKYENCVFRHEGTQEEPDFYKRWFDKLAL